MVQEQCLDRAAAEGSSLERGREGTIPQSTQGPCKRERQEDEPRKRRHSRSLQLWSTI